MAILTGTRLGPHEMLSALGAGGMGEVYRAHDTKLGRDVAIKILPHAFVSDPEGVARFQREARTLASLNHPNIGGIYGLEEADGATALVLELVGGAHPRRPDCRRATSDRGSAGSRPPDRRGPRGGARAGDHPPRPQARERQGARRRHREGARLRARESDRGHG